MSLCGVVDTLGFSHGDAWWRSLKVEVRTDPDVFVELSDWWNAQEGPSRWPFLRTEWFETWARTRLGEHDQLQVFTVVDGGTPRASVPMVRSRNRTRSLSEGVSHVFDLVHDGDPDPVQVLMRALGRETRVILDRVDGDSPLARMARENRSWQVQRSLSSPFVDLGNGIDAVDAFISSSLKRNIRRGSRRLESVGTLEMTPLVATADLPRVLREILDLESKGWKGRAGTAVASNPMTMRFFEMLTEIAAHHDWLRLAVLRVDGRVVGFNYDLEYDRRLFGIFTSFDETMDARSSIGAVLFSMLLRHAVDRGITSYEMGGDARNDWKMMWTSETRSRVDISGFGSNAMGRLTQTFAPLRRRLTSLGR